MKTKTRKVVVAVAFALAAGTAAAGDDVKNIAVGAGLGVLGQMLQGKPVTLEGTLKSAAGAAVGSQIGGGSGSTAAAAIGGLAGQTLFDGLAGVVQDGGAQSNALGAGGSVLDGIGGGAQMPAQVELAIERSVRVSRTTGGAFVACEGERCVPVTMAAPARRFVLEGPHGAMLCEGADGGLLCRTL